MAVMESEWDGMGWDEMLYAWRYLILKMDKKNRDNFGSHEYKNQ